jgi:hypothetical protein
MTNHPESAARVAASGIPMSANCAPQDLAAQLEAAFAKARTQAEARQAAQLAVDSVPTDNIAVLRERAERHAHEAVDQYWGHFNDMQRMLAQRVITPLLDTISRIAAERDDHRAAAERVEAKLRKIEHGCETPESHLYGCPCEQAGGAP